MKKNSFNTARMFFQAFMLIIFILGGCQKFEAVDDSKLSGNGYDSKGVLINSSGTNCTDIMAGQTTDAGDVCLDDIDTDNDGTVDALQVTYTTENGWELLEIHYVISKSFSDLPTTKKGNLIPGQFPYTDENIPAGLTSYSLTIPFTDIDYTCGDDGSLYAAAHCVVGIPDGTGGYTQTETGWGEGQDPEGGNWAMYFMFTISCDPDDPPQTPDGCETAFAFGGDFATCFIGADFDGDGIDDGFNRWGWSNGPLAAGTYTFEIWSGAGQCNTNSGYNTGYLTIEYDGTQAIVTFNMYGDNTMDETHLYVGNDPLPTNNGEYTVAPGQYPYIHGDLNGASTDSYTITGLSGDIYVVAHANVCGLEGPPPCDETIGIVYGMERFTGDVYKVDLLNGTSEFSFSSSNAVPASASPNGLAYDFVNKRMYYCDYSTNTSPKPFFFWDYENGVEVSAGTLSYENAAADFYDGKYYYIASLPGTDDLYEVTFNPDGTVASETKIADISNNAQAWTFNGDIAIKDGVLYGWGANGGTYQFFVYDMGTGTYTYNNTAYQQSLQLVFGSNSNDLYGHRSGAPGNFYPVSKVDGSLGAAISISGGELYTDCASGQQCY